MEASFVVSSLLEEAASYSLHDSQEASYLHVMHHYSSSLLANNLYPNSYQCGQASFAERSSYLQTFEISCLVMRKSRGDEVIFKGTFADY